MKKFFIVLCGILVIGDAFGAAKDLVEPTVVDETLRTSWELYPWNFTESVANKFMASWMIGEDHQAGACGEYDEGAGLAIIATDIFDNGNGAEFCTRQIQAANGRSKSWIDFYDTKNYKCNSVCKPGFYGSKCDKTSFQGECTVDYTSKFDNINDAALLEDKTNTYCDDAGVIKTAKTDVFWRELNQSNGDSRVVVLGVLEVKPHAIIVGPVEIKTHRKNSNDSWIEYVRGNGNTKVLCAPGYVVNSNKDDCVPSPSCATEEEMLSNLCPGFSGNEYKSVEHSLFHNDVQKCYYFRCQSNKGFTSVNNKNCIECPGGKLAYIKSDGTCGKCAKGEIAKNTHDGCWKENEVTQYSKDQMKSNDELQCWLETDARKFLGCVKGRCSGATPCWDKTHGCKACD